MAKTATLSTPVAALAKGVDPARIGGAGMAAMMRTQAKMMDAVLKQNIETLDFLRGRYEKDRALFASLAEVRNPDEAFAAWKGFWSKALADYSDEAGKLGSLAAATTEQVLEGIREEATILAGAETDGD